MDIISLNEAKKALRKLKAFQSEMDAYQANLDKQMADFIAGLNDRFENFHYHVGTDKPTDPVDGMWWFDTATGFPKYYRASDMKWINPHAYL